MSRPAGRRPHFLTVAAATTLAGIATFAIGTPDAEALPIRGVKVPTNNGSKIVGTATVFNPPAAKWCHGFAQAYLVLDRSAEGRGFRIVRRFGKHRINFRPCGRQRFDRTGVRVTFRRTNLLRAGTFRVCFRAWGPLRNGARSNHIACKRIRHVPA